MNPVRLKIWQDFFMIQFIGTLKRTVGKNSDSVSNKAVILIKF